MKKQQNNLINEYTESIEKEHIGIIGNGDSMFGYSLHFASLLSRIQNNKYKVLLVDKYGVMRNMFFDNTLPIYTRDNIDIVSYYEKVDNKDYDVVIELIDIKSTTEFETNTELQRCTSLIFLATQDYKSISALNEFAELNYEQFPKVYFVELNVVGSTYSPETLIKTLCLDTDEKVVEKHTIYLDEGNLQNGVYMQFNSKVTFKLLSREYLEGLKEIVASIFTQENFNKSDFKKCFR